MSRVASPLRVAELFEWDDGGGGGLKLANVPWHLDSRRPRPRCVVSHAHSDHLPWGDLFAAGGESGGGPNPAKVHGKVICTPATAAIGGYRSGLALDIETREFGEAFSLGNGVTGELLPAGHVLGSAMTFVQSDRGRLLYTGDYKLREGRTTPPAQPREADVLVMESTYGSPFFRFPPAAEVEQQLVDLVHEAVRAGKQPVVHGYSLGKSQEIIKILTDAGFNVTQHGAVAKMSAFYEQFGVSLGRPDQLRRYAASDFRGAKQVDLEERGVLVCPPRDARGPVTGQFGDKVCRIIMSGWALSKNARFRYGVEHALPLSDHADWDELVETIERVRPKFVVAHHGFAEFPEHLHAAGLPAKLGFEVRLAKPPVQMELF